MTSVAVVACRIRYRHRFFSLSLALRCDVRKSSAGHGKKFDNRGLKGDQYGGLHNPNRHLGSERSGLHGHTAKLISFENDIRASGELQSATDFGTRIRTSDDTEIGYFYLKSGS